MNIYFDFELFESTEFNNLMFDTLLEAKRDIQNRLRDFDSKLTEIDSIIVITLKPSYSGLITINIADEELFEKVSEIVKDFDIATIFERMKKSEGN